MIKSVQTSFAIIKGKNRLLSTFSCLERAIQSKGLTEKEIRHLFLELVEDIEYDKYNRERIILYLIEKTKKPL